MNFFCKINFGVERLGHSDCDFNMTAITPVIATAVLGLAGMEAVIAFVGVGVCLHFRRDKHIWQLEE